MTSKTYPTSEEVTLKRRPSGEEVEDRSSKQRPRPQQQQQQQQQHQQQHALDSSLSTTMTATTTTTSPVVARADHRSRGPSVAKRRWMILRGAIVSATSDYGTTAHTANSVEDISLRRFSSFQLFRVTRMMPTSTTTTTTTTMEKTTTTPDSSEREGEDVTWFEYRLEDFDEDLRRPLTLSVHLRVWTEKIRVGDLIDFDNTGNVCVWPSEEVLAFYLSRRPALVRDKVVLELGGGMTCLAGVMAAKIGAARRVILTDGNAKAVDNVRIIIRANRLEDDDGEKEDENGKDGEEEEMVNFGIPPSPLLDAPIDSSRRWRPRCSARLLRWDAVAAHASDLRGGVDLIIAADCLFFDAFRQSLVDTLDFLLAADGLILIFAPRRKKTMEDFLRRAIAKGFVVAKKLDRYDDVVTAKLKEAKASNLFDEDIHYPHLVHLTRGEMGNEAK